MKESVILFIMIFFTVAVSFPAAPDDSPYTPEQQDSLSKQELLQKADSIDGQTPKTLDNVKIEEQDDAKIDASLPHQPKHEDKTKIRLIGNRLIIEELPQDDALEIYNIMGVKVFHRRVKAGSNEFLLSLSKGYYIIKVGKMTRKIAIK